MTTHSACANVSPASADGNVRMTCAFVYNLNDLNNLDLTLGNLWELAPPQRVDSPYCFQYEDFV